MRPCTFRVERKDQAGQDRTGSGLWVMRCEVQEWSLGLTGVTWQACLPPCAGDMEMIATS